MTLVVLPVESPPSPIRALRLFADAPMPALLHSAGVDPRREDAGRWSILVAAPFDTVAWSLGERRDPFSAVSEAAGRFAVHHDSGLPFAGGAVGYIGYDAGRMVEPVRAGSAAAGGPPPRERLADLHFGLYSWGVIWDHRLSRCAVVATGHPARGAARASKARSDAERAAGRLRRAGTGRAAPAVASPRASLAAVRGSSVSRRRYTRNVLEAKHLIEDGEIYQVNLSQRLELSCRAPAVDLFEAMARLSPAPFSAFLDLGTTQLLSASPERFVSLRGRRVESRPIKGTRPRGSTEPEDHRLAAELRSSAKDRAENVMIVDLVRNDLGRVCVPGSVVPSAVCRVESYASVHHLVSIVEGELAEGVDRAALLRALFPPGSMTGAPKVRAMQAIEDLEPRRRGVYSGALGYLSFCGGMDLSVVIRTLVRSGTSLGLQVGGGVVADSDPGAEYEETLDKAGSVRRAVAATSPGRTRRDPSPPREPRTSRHRSAR